MTNSKSLFEEAWKILRNLVFLVERNDIFFFALERHIYSSFIFQRAERKHKIKIEKLTATKSWSKRHGVYMRVCNCKKQQISRFQHEKLKRKTKIVYRAFQAFLFAETVFCFYLDYFELTLVILVYSVHSFCIIPVRMIELLKLQLINHFICK